jgi:hypothetical protein
MFIIGKGNSMTRVRVSVMPRGCSAWVLVLSLVSFGTTSVFCQSTTDWRLDAPPQTVELVQVDQLTSDGLRFTFRNVSNKAIVEYCASASEKEMACVDGFLQEDLQNPGSTMTLNFSSQGLVSDGDSNHVLHLKAIVYADGSHVGTHAVLDDIEDRMLGAALETKRILNILSESTDDSIRGLDNARSELAIVSPSDALVAASQMKGISLPGIPQSYIDSRLSRCAVGIMEGMTAVRDLLSREIDDEKEIAAMSPSGKSQSARLLIERAALHGRSDLAQKYQARSKDQIEQFRSFAGGRNE